nr:MAG TPA: hypothetical protein [Caudoviricetes sp.]
MPVSWSKIIYNRICLIKRFSNLLHNWNRLFSSLLLCVLNHLKRLANNRAILSRIIKE